MPLKTFKEFCEMFVRDPIGKKIGIKKIPARTFTGVIKAYPPKSGSSKGGD